MNRQTIDFGIDLGTTNSSIAMWGPDGQVEVFKNQQQSQSTPSAVYEGRRGRVLIGFEAKQQMTVDPDNLQIEFKQQMGRSTRYTFPVSGRSMKPEELSAEVLKSMKGDVQRRLNEEIKAAVITIPAAFEKSEIYATNKAAELAGFIANPLCLEPVAAALVYGHQNASKNGFWMVFDFGGGTFDAAIVQLKDEEFNLINHHGDNYLGGKLIDWAIVDNFLIPAVQKEFNRPDFDRKNEDPKVKTAILKLKMRAENAKVELSTGNSCWVSDESLIQSPSGDSLPFDFELKRADVNRISEPYIIRAINLCRQALKEKRLNPHDMDRLILVGGPTQMPIFREMLADKTVGLGIPLEYSVDPMTVVAQGAAIFARTQKMIGANGPRGQQPQKEEVAVELEYEPAGADDQPVVAGKLIAGPGERVNDFTIEFSKADWRSGRIRVTNEGTFMTQLVAEPNENIYKIEVQDASGRIRKVSPDRINYLRRPFFREIPLSHSIAAGRVDNSIDLIFEKGIALPVKKTRRYSQTLAVLKSDPKSEIRIPIVEGSNARADRNKCIGAFVIKSNEVKRDVPPGSEVEFTISIDRSNRLAAVAYVPILDQEFQVAIDLTRPNVDKDWIRKDAEIQISRLKAIQKKVDEFGDAKAKTLFDRIKSEKMLEEVENALALIDKGGDADDLLLNRLRDLKLGIDDVESALTWPDLVKQAEKNKADAEKMLNVSKHADSNDKAAFARLCIEHQQALKAEDPDLLRRVSSEYDSIYYTVAHKDPGFWVAIFENLGSSQDKMTDPELAKDLFAQGRRAIDNNDVDGLRSAVRQLGRLLPREEAAKISGLGGTII